MLKFGRLQLQQQHMKNRYYYSWQELEEDCKKLARKIRPIKFNFSNIYGVPRGGLVIAVILSHLLDLPVILNKDQITKNTLIVDDISDTGNTLNKIIKIKKPKAILTLFTTQTTKVFPDYYMHIKDKWVVYPWETINSSKLDKTI
jgi:uncharacterized protein